MKFKSNTKYGEPVENGSIYEGKIGNLYIFIHHIYNGESWYLSCHNMNISNEPLESKDIINAINESKEILKKVVNKFQKDVDAFCKENIELSRY